MQYILYGHQPNQNKIWGLFRHIRYFSGEAMLADNNQKLLMQLNSYDVGVLKLRPAFKNMLAAAAALLRSGYFMNQ
jgi:hypothetical protein